MNFLAVPMNDKQGNYGMISVTSNPDENNMFQVLYMTKDGYAKKMIPVDSINGKKPFIERMLKWIQTQISAFSFSEVYYVEGNEIKEEFLRIESLAPEVKQNFFFLFFFF